MRSTLLPVFAVLAITLPVLSAVPVADAQTGLTVALDGVQGHYGPESWKDVPPLGQSGLPLTSPVPGATVYENPYANRPHFTPTGPANYWGHLVDFNLSLVDGQGNPVNPSATTTYVLGGHVQTPLGRIPIQWSRIDAVSFTARIDADGEQGRTDFPALPAGASTLHVDIYNDPTDPTQTRKKIGDADIPISSVAVGHNLPGMFIPDANVMYYSDTGAGNHSILYPRQIGPTETIEAIFNFGVPNATAQVVLGDNRNRLVIAEESTGSTGRIAVNVSADAILGVVPNGMLILEAHLVGGVGLFGPVGSTAILIPVSPNNVTISDLLYEGRGLGDTEIPDFASLRVVALDSSATATSGSRRGTLLVRTGMETLTTAEFAPDAQNPSIRSARIPARTLAAEELSRYGLFAMFSDQQNRFYGMASAERGLAVSVEAAALRPQQDGALLVTVRNLNDNFNAGLDVGLSLPVNVVVQNLPGGGTFEKTVTLDEGGESVIEVPLRAGSIGFHAIHVNATAGELRVERVANLLVTVAEPSDQGFWQEAIPGPGAGLLVLAGVAVALLARRKRV